MENEFLIYRHERTETPEDERLLGHKAYTGFPNQASDQILPPLSLDEYLIPNKTATFTIKVSGHSMREANLLDGDLIVVDRSKRPVNGSIIVAVVNSEFTIRVFHKKGERLFLVPKNPSYRPIEISPEDDFLVWGVVNFIIH
ncbi:MAG: LexA family protein, partial [Bacteriovorax sp.]